MPDNAAVDFRAPPPSPVASGRKSSFTNEDILSEFLQHTLKVPDLVLPDRAFPRQRILHDIPNLDFGSLASLDKDSVASFIDEVSKTGCFEVFNHGVPPDLIGSGLDSGSGIFGVPPEKRRVVTRSLERPFGFEDSHGDDEKEMMSEEFVWCNDQRLKKDMEGILPLGYSNFSVKMEMLLSVLEILGGKILQFLEENSPSATNSWEDIMKKQEKEFFGPICCIQKHNNLKNNQINEESMNNSLRYDVIRMLVRGSEFPHALCVHLCNGAQEFHVYSKKGWLSFHPHQHALLITIGDQLQERVRGQYKHVIGRPIFKGEDDQQFTSMAFMYSPPTAISKSDRGDKESQTISIGQQIIFVILFTFLCQCIFYTFKVFGG